MARHRRTRRQLKKQRKIIIVSLICFMFLMVGGYSAFQTNLNITAKGNIKEKSRVIQAWSSTDQTDFHSDYYRENIVTATFLDNNQVPDNATESWNVSEDKKHGGVVAWVIPNNEDNTKYDLFIGANKGVIANEDSSYLFHAFISLKSIDFQKNFDTSHVISMHQMFYYCRNLSVLDISMFNTDNVINMAGMFAGGNNLKVIDLTSFNTSNVTDMNGMFTTWNLIIDGWANGVLEKIIFSPNFDTSQVTNMESMFAGLRKLKILDISNFNTANVTNMYHMFNSCQSLTELNLCSFDTKNVNNMNNMFAWTNNIKNIYVGTKWIINSDIDTTAMFSGSGVSSVTTGQC